MERGTPVREPDCEGKEEHEAGEARLLENHKKKTKVHTIKRKRKKRDDRITLNVVDTKYEIVRHVGKEILGWKLCRESYISKNWDVYWTDSAIKTEFLAKLEKYQKVNHFPGSFCED